MTGEMHLRLRRLLAGAGVACLVASAVCFASEGVLLAAPLMAVDLHLPLGPLFALVEPPPVPDASPSPNPTPSATPAPSPSPSRGPERHSFLGEGPIVLAGTGTYQLGVNRQTRNGLDDDINDYATDLTITAERRTEQSALEVSDSFGEGGGEFNSGSFIVSYRTPKYTLSYGQLAGPADTQLEIGGFARGVSLTFPLRNGDVSYMSAIASNQEDETFRIFGARRDWTALGGYFGLAGYYGAGEQGGRESIADLSFQRYGAALSTQAEVAVGNSSGIVDQPSGTTIAAGVQVNLQGKNSGESLDLRLDPAGFNTLTGEIDPGLSASLALRRQGNFGNVSIDLSHIDDRDINGDVTHSNDLTINGGKSWGHLGIEYVGNYEDEQIDGVLSLDRSGGLTLTEQFKKFSLFATIQKASASTSNAGTATTSQTSLGVTHPLFGGAASYQWTESLGTGSGASVAQTSGIETDQELEFHRSVGKKADIEVTEGFENSRNNFIPSRILETTVSLVRRLSPVVSVQGSLDRYHQTGPGGGNGNGFSLSLIGPFGFGAQPGVLGRANPHLPAVIRGTVTFAATQSLFANNPSASRGLNNALVILDDGITERTDSSGTFEFRFVTQGAHVVRIDPATLPPGLVLDREYQTLNVLGGQTSTVQFNAGNFAAVAGRVYAKGAGGKEVPLGKIGIAVDGIQATVTTPDGHYQVGRLSPGAHTIEVVTATVPSTIAFSEETKKTVSVAAGAQTPLDFVASTLGSIAGFVYTAGQGGFGDQVGMNNVYVVAEPGEHAGITNDDGSFLLDNLPPGSYTLSVDPETIPDGLGVTSGPDGPVDLAGGAAVSGVIFRLGSAPKSVVFTFDQGKRQAIQVSVEPEAAPPGAVLRVTAQTSAKDVHELMVQSDVFGNFPLREDKRTGTWSGMTLVPILQRGDYSLTVTAGRKDVTDNTVLVLVEPALPLETIRLYPAKPLPGHSVKVSLKSYAPLAEGDTVLFQDGYKVLLPKPNGRLFVFDVRLWDRGLPYSATVVTKRGQNYPISLR
jgi:hypothetical protein